MLDDAISTQIDEINNINKYNKANNFGYKSLIYILENVDTLINHLLQAKQSFSITPSISPNGEPSMIKESNYVGLDILLYTLQNTEIILQTIIKKEPKESSLSTVVNAITSAVQVVSEKSKPLAESIGELNEYFTPDLELPNEDGSHRQENLNYGQDRLEYYKGNDITIAETDTQTLMNGLIENPIEEKMSKVTKIQLVPDKTGDSNAITEWRNKTRRELQAEPVEELESRLVSKDGSATTKYNASTEGILGTNVDKILKYKFEEEVTNPSTNNKKTNIVQ